MGTFNIIVSSEASFSDVSFSRFIIIIFVANSCATVPLDIDSKYQRTGLGRRLIESTIALSKAVGVKKIYGQALDNEYDSSVGFYEKCGFEIKKQNAITMFHMIISKNATN